MGRKQRTDAWNGLTLFVMALILLIIGVVLTGSYVLRTTNSNSIILSETYTGFILGNFLVSISILMIFYGAIFIAVGYS